MLLCAPGLSRRTYLCLPYLPATASGLALKQNRRLRVKTGQGTAPSPKGILQHADFFPLKGQRLYHICPVRQRQRYALHHFRRQAAILQKPVHFPIGSSALLRKGNGRRNRKQVTEETLFRQAESQGQILPALPGEPLGCALRQQLCQL